MLSRLLGVPFSWKPYFLPFNYLNFFFLIKTMLEHAIKRKGGEVNSSLLIDEVILQEGNSRWTREGWNLTGVRTQRKLTKRSLVQKYTATTASVLGKFGKYLSITASVLVAYVQAPEFQNLEFLNFKKISKLKVNLIEPTLLVGEGLKGRKSQDSGIFWHLVLIV